MMQMNTAELPVPFARNEEDRFATGLRMGHAAEYQASLNAENEHCFELRTIHWAKLN